MKAGIPFVIAYNKSGFRRLIGICSVLCMSLTAYAQSPKYEMRGVWVATVVNLDWPVRGASPASQQQALRQLFDRLQRAGINAVFFQVRSESDAFYDSPKEPWSYYLTGVQGMAPVPAWDPLAFAIEEAHKRGMELHAWINPFRVIRSISATYPKASGHLSVQKPEWMLAVKNILLLNPGIPEARQYLIEVLSDIVQRYEVDGLHYDDYFYPYEGITTEDQTTFTRYGGGLSLDAWREDNINRFVKELGQEIFKYKPWLKYGVSPFGIWKSGVPAGVTGLSGASVTYGNGVHWLQEQWIDYLSPQLYWPFGGNQDFARLSLWWKEQLNGRHLYPGLAAYRAEPSMTTASTLYAPSELPRQIRFLRENQILGNLLFRAANIGATPTQGLSDSLYSNLYRFPALTPIMSWKSNVRPAAPSTLRLIAHAGTRRLEWKQLSPIAGEAIHRFFAVYRVASTVEPDWNSAIQLAENLLSVQSDLFFDDSTPENTESPFWYAVTAISPNSVESRPAIPDISTASREIARIRIRTEVFPNPFTEELHIRYVLEKTARVSLRIIHAGGQEVTRLIDGERQIPGSYEVSWRPVDQLVNQLYFIVWEVDGKRVAKKVFRG